MLTSLILARLHCKNITGLWGGKLPARSLVGHCCNAATGCGVGHSLQPWLLLVGARPVPGGERAWVARGRGGGKRTERQGANYWQVEVPVQGNGSGRVAGRSKAVCSGNSLFKCFWMVP